MVLRIWDLSPKFAFLLSIGAGILDSRPQKQMQQPIVVKLSGGCCHQLRGWQSFGGAAACVAATVEDMSVGAFRAWN